MRIAGESLASLVLLAAGVVAGCSPQADPAPAVAGGVGAAAPSTATPPPAPDAEGPLVVYCGRSEALVGAVFARYREVRGREVQVRYADTAELAATLLEEGDRSPADVYVAQDSGALGAVSDRGRLAPLPARILDLVPRGWRSSRGDWVGVSGRARVVAYSTERVKPGDLPTSLLGFTDPKWKGRIGWAPMNASFQAAVTALRKRLGEDGARKWLEGILANEPREYPKNSPAVAAVAAGEIDVAFVNHYYLLRFLEEKGDAFPVRNAFMAPGDAGNLVNVAGAAVLRSSKRPAAAADLVEFLLGAEAQAHFAKETLEYPARIGVPLDPRLGDAGVPDDGGVDLNALADLEGTLDLLRRCGVLR